MKSTLVVIMVAALVAVGDAATRNRRQASGCFWWAGECKEENKDGQEPQAGGDADKKIEEEPTVRQHHQHQEYQEYASCDKYRGVCVPYYLCRDNNIVTDGAGIIDIRIGGQKDNVTRSTSECPSFLDVCCTSPLPSTTTPPPAPYRSDCGKRNYQGIDVRIQGFQLKRMKVPAVGRCATENGGTCRVAKEEYFQRIMQYHSGRIVCTSERVWMAWHEHLYIQTKNLERERWVAVGEKWVQMGWQEWGW